MIPREASALLAVMRHIDGSQPIDPTDLMTDVELLVDAAGVALGGVLPVDLDAIAETLSEVEQRHSDAAECWWDDDAQKYRPTDDAPIGGEVL